MLALGLSGELAAKLVHFELGVLTCILVYRVGSLESRRCGLLALLFLISEPLLYSEMAWAYADLIGPFYALFAFVSLRDWLRTRDRALLLRAGLFAGACLATRYLGGAVLLGLCAALWLTPGRESLATRVRGTLALAGLSTLALLPWLVRNLIAIGNPIAPIAQAIFHAPGAEYFRAAGDPPDLRVPRPARDGARSPGADPAALEPERRLHAGHRTRVALASGSVRCTRSTSRARSPSRCCAAGSTWRADSS